MASAAWETLTSIFFISFLSVYNIVYIPFLSSTKLLSRSLLSRIRTLLVRSSSPLLIYSENLSIYKVNRRYEVFDSPFRGHRDVRGRYC
jgi:hypothetical protein